MTGSNSIQQLWEESCKHFKDAPPSQTEIIQLVSQLHNADLISAQTRPNFSEISRRVTEEDRKTALGYFKNPLSLRIPVFDPEPLLKKCSTLAFIIFSPFGFFIWITLIIAAIVVTIMSWSELEAPRIEAILTGQNIAYLAISYVFVKILHELGHGLAIKKYGAEVREFGIMMLVFFPVPYVDASQSAFFKSKYQRMLVSAAGVMTELAIAALALIIWSFSEAGAISTFAYNLFLIGGISTLLFNGNPLLRFDGYFVFADLIESPNLGNRANQFFWYIVQKHILGFPDAIPPVIGYGEEKWLLGYSILAFIYRMFVMVLISLYVASTIPVLGIVIVLWSLYTILLVPMGKGFKFIAFDSRLETYRMKAILRFVSAATISYIFFFVVPFPHTTILDAVIDTPSEGQVRANGQGFVAEIIARNGAWVSEGDAILRLEDPLLLSEYALVQADLADSRLRFASVPLTDTNSRSAWREQIEFFEARASDLEKRMENLMVRAQSDGQFASQDLEDLLGQMLLQGDVIGTILNNERRLWRAAAPADRALFIDNDSKNVSLRINMRPDLVLEAFPISRSPEVTTRLDSFALSSVAGGRHILDPNFETPVSISPVVNYVFLSSDIGEDILLPTGARGVIRITHSMIPLSSRIERLVRSTFLRFFGV